jgi:aminoglycoside 3-N-acetyltransferase
MTSHDYIPIRDIPAALSVGAGENILMASDLTQLAMQAIRKEGHFSPDELIDSLLQALGTEGTMIIPAFNFNLRNGDIFDVKKTMPITGALAEAALKRADFFRTRHPLHSFLVSGKYADELVRMRNISSFGPDSPFAFFRENDVRMLMIGTGVTEAFTFVHHAEEMEKVGYRRYKEVRINYVDEDGKAGPVRIRIYTKKPGWTMDLAPLEAKFREEGLLIERSINRTTCYSIHLGESFSVIKNDILHHRAKHISRFSRLLFLKEILKATLSALHIYKTPSEKIAHAPGPR